MNRSKTLARAAVIGIAVAMMTGTAARAEVYNNPALPRSPYALPQPRYQAPDEEGLLFGNGELHSSGQWRHWGDIRNEGETFQQIFAPNGVAGGGDGDPEARRAARFCNFNPGRC